MVGLTGDRVARTSHEKSKVTTVCQQHRIDIVRSIKGVDKAFINFADYHAPGQLRHVMEYYFKQYNIDVYVIGDEPSVRKAYTAAKLEDFVEVVYLPRTAGVSSTELKAKVRGSPPPSAAAAADADAEADADADADAGVGVGTTASEIAEWTALGAQLNQSFKDQVSERAGKRLQEDAPLAGKEGKKAKTDPTQIN